MSESEKRVCVFRGFCFWSLTLHSLTPSTPPPLHPSTSSGAVTSVKISPDNRSIVSVGSTGEIIFWEMPSLEEMRELASV